MRPFCLTFDVEEFFDLNNEEMFEISFAGLKKMEELLEDFDIKSTMFVTSSFANVYPHEIRKLSRKYEIALHGISTNKNSLLSEKETLENIINQSVFGLRMHRMMNPNFGVLKSLGFVYDSSIHPTIVPGRYNRMFSPTRIRKINEVFEVPPSVAVFRIPISFVSFRVLPLNIVRKMVLNAVKRNGYVLLYFHPWEFVDLERYSIPFLLKKNTGEYLVSKMKRFLEWTINIFDFMTISEMLTFYQ